MSKKNNKARKQKYVKYLIEKEKEEEQARKEKQIKKATNQMTKELTNEIEDLDLVRNKEEKMEVETKADKARRKKRRVFKHRKRGRYS